MASVSASPDRPQFSDLLRSWRKLRNVSQTSLSLKAEISQRHLSFLESGRSRPSRNMVVLLANALDLALREQNAMLASAGFANIYSEHKIDNKELKHARQALQIMLKCHEPYGALVIDRNWNILMMNDANLRIFSLFVDSPNNLLALGEGPLNLMRIVLHPKGLKSCIKNWQEFAIYFLSQLERELATNPYNREARELLNEVRSYPGMSNLEWRTPKENQPFLPMTLNNDDIELSFFSLISTFGTPQDVTLQELRIETFFPANEETEKFVRQLH